MYFILGSLSLKDSLDVASLIGKVSRESTDQEEQVDQWPPRKKENENFA